MLDSLAGMFFLWLWTIFCHSAFQRFHLAAAVDLDNSGEILHFQSGDTLTRTCWSFYESTWVLPDNDQYRKEDDDPSQYGRLSIIETRTVNGWFKAKLILRDLRYTDTGFYTCKAKTSIFDDVNNYSGREPQFTHIYVLVSSANPRQVFLHGKDDGQVSYVRQLPVWKNRDSYIPCLATRVDVDLTLRIDGVLDKHYEYDLRYGFLLPANSLEFDEARSGRCLALANVSDSSEAITQKVVDRVQILLVPIEHTDLSKPTIRLASHLLYKNGDLKMYCLYPGDPSKPEMVFINCTWSFSDQDGVKLLGTSASNKTLWIPELDTGHSGNYTCTCRHVLDNDRETGESYYVDVSPTKGRIFYLSPVGPLTSTRDAGESVQFAARYLAWPKDSVQTQWFHRYRDGSSRFEVTELIESHQSNILRLHNLRINQSGIYAFRITVGGDLRRELLFSLLVYGQSHDIQVFIAKAVNESFDAVEDSRFLEFGKSYHVYCVSEGFPLPELKILRSPCARPKARNDCNWSETDQNRSNVTIYEGDFRKSIRLVTTARTSGVYTCQVATRGNPTNGSVYSSQTVKYIVSDIEGAQQQKSLSVTLITEDSFGEIYETDAIVAVCQYQPLVYSQVRWAILSNRIWNTLDISGNGLIALKSNTTLSTSKILKFPNIQLQHAGKYACLAKYAPDMGSGYELRRFQIVINETVPPSFGNSTSPQVQTITLGYPPVEIFCDAQGAPRPTVAWLKDNAPLELENGTVDEHAVELFNESRLLVIRRPRAEDGGIYTCIVQNRFEIIHADFDIRISSVLVQSALSYWIIGLLAIALILLTAVTIFLLISLALLRKRKKSAIAMRMSHLRQLYDDLISSIGEGAQLDPDQPVNEQTENLPYDRKYEIPIEHLLVGRLLGEGQFGRVYEGLLTNSDGRVTTAAVKTPKIGTDPDQQKALLSEFKIMIYIEDHVNVLRLLGGVTKHIVNGRLYIVVEYCRLGSLSDYLKRNRNHFVDELLTPSTLEDAYESSVDKDGYLVPNSSASGNSSDVDSNGYSGRKLYRAELDPRWSKKASENRLYENYVSTSDLLSYVYQVANGMDYLASKKIIHRDLAVRNVLLNETKIVKICDFGLSRQDYAYHTTKVGLPLPVKWMAIESILYQEYTVKSDVWAFGVVMWEIFSLAQTPYTGQVVDRNFIRWLKIEDNRMACPDYASEKIYSIMRQCWLSIPDDRPEFSDCRRRIGREFTRCSSDYYRELLNALGLIDDAKSDSAPAPVACQRFNSSRSDDQSQDGIRHTGNADAVANLSYFGYPSGRSEDETEMAPLGPHYSEN